MNRLAIEKDPFRVFFPLGIILGIAGLIPWMGVFWKQASYPLPFHRAIMMNGFLLAFVAGFLMTAVPRFTGSGFATIREVSFVWGILLLSALAAMLGHISLHYLLASVAMIGLITFACRRFLAKRSNPPSTFVFVGPGLAFWLLANLVQAAAASLRLLPSDPILSIAFEIFSHGAVLGLIIGIGSRLIPGIFGWTEIVASQREVYEVDKPFTQVIPKAVWFALVMFWASYFLGPWLPHAIKLGIRALVVIYFALSYWQLHRLPRNKGFLTSSVWVSALCLVLGLVLQWIWPSGATHALHVVLIGGFALLTLMIASRVSLAHGSEGTAHEASMKIFGVLTSLFLLSMAIRVAAIFFSGLYLQLLGSAAFVFILGLMIWLGNFIRGLWAPLKKPAQHPGIRAHVAHDKG